MFVEGLNKIGLKTLEPDGALYCFPSIEITGLDAMTFAKKLLKQYQVAVVPGTAFDLRTGWDIDKEESRAEVWERIEASDPEYLLLSPRCTPFSQLQGLNKEFQKTARYQDMLARCMRHLEFAKPEQSQCDRAQDSRVVDNFL